MGRRTPNFDYHYLKGWNFYGKNKDNRWILLSSFSNSQFKFAEIRTYNLNETESFKEFRIQMTEPDSLNYWALCLGQIEVFGDIYSYPYKKGNSCTRMIYRKRYSYLLSLIIVMITVY